MLRRAEGRHANGNGAARSGGGRENGLCATRCAAISQSRPFSLNLVSAKCSIIHNRHLSERGADRIQLDSENVRTAARRALSDLGIAAACGGGGGESRTRIGVSGGLSAMEEVEETL